MSTNICLLKPQTATGWDWEVGPLGGDQAMKEPVMGLASVGKGTLLNAAF